MICFVKGESAPKDGMKKILKKQLTGAGPVDIIKGKFKPTTKRSTFQCKLQSEPQTVRVR